MKEINKNSWIIVWVKSREEPIILWNIFFISTIENLWMKCSIREYLTPWVFIKDWISEVIKQNFVYIHNHKMSFQ